ncbi:hypothetical protein [Vibrio europaeus]|uniref:hypothetical protein n=1 Tax=Vibrio europaeus TaxID=300876 RepID=UPI00233E5A61|nr:hypothetical protein [Vibrio europaeus]MDC5753569.1 hypothetical protein [Vibrio europaeus]MDC5816519.1 hypothetical protein [Vibrio europaeus]
MRAIPKKAISTITSTHSEMKDIEDEYDRMLKELELKIDKLIINFDKKNSERLNAMAERYIELSESLKATASSQHERMDAYIGGRSTKWLDEGSGVKYCDWAYEWGVFVGELDMATMTDLGVEVRFERIPGVELPPFKV